MDTSEALRLTDNVVGNAVQLKVELAHERSRREIFQQLFTLRQSIQRLEGEIQENDSGVLGDAC